MNEVRNSTKGNEHEPKLVIRKLSDTTDSSDNVEAKIAFETVDGVIVLLDALGIKGIWKRKDPAEVLGTWSLLQSEYAKGIESLRAKLRAYGDLKETKFEAFSDTIMVSLPITKREVGRDSGRNSSWWTIMLIGEWLTDIFRVSTRHNFYFRGCLSAGTFYRSENMTIGPAVDRDVNADAAASNVNNANIMPPVDLVSNLYIDMLKEIIICDYNHVDYNPKTDDDLLSLATSAKSRKKVTRLLTRGIEQYDCRSNRTR